MDKRKFDLIITYISGLVIFLAGIGAVMYSMIGTILLPRVIWGINVSAFAAMALFSGLVGIYLGVTAIHQSAEQLSKIYEKNKRS